MSNEQARQEYAAGRHSDEGADDPLAVQQGGRDREPHPERVDRPRAFEKQGLVGIEAVAIDQPLHALAPGLGDGRAEPEVPRSLEGDRPHDGEARPRRRPSRTRRDSALLGVVRRAEEVVDDRGLVADAPGVVALREGRDVAGRRIRVPSRPLSQGSRPGPRRRGPSPTRTPSSTRTCCATSPCACAACWPPSTRPCPRACRTQSSSSSTTTKAWPRAVLEEGQRERTLRFGGSPAETARMVVSGLEGAMPVALSYGDVARFRGGGHPAHDEPHRSRAEDVVGSLSGAGRIRTRDTRVKSPLL
jgi:hypothetical protein